MACGTVARALAAVVGSALPLSSAEPAASLLVLGSTLVVGRLVTLRFALTYGACAWGIALASSGLLHAPSASYHVSALLLSLLLVEEMALLGRLTAICSSRAHAHRAA